MSVKSSRIVIAGVSSGVGKTSVSLGITRALVDRGLRVQAFKVGPDFLDPQHLSAASGRICFNLDSWMTDEAYISNIFGDLSSDADISVIEGVMGMFDGADPTTISGSTAETALILNAPVLLIVNSHGMGGSIAALVKGYMEFHPEVSLAGVIANKCGSSRHAEIIKKALASAGLPPLVGAIPRNSLPKLPGRHLGLVTPEQDSFPKDLIADLAKAISAHIDLDQILSIANSAPPLQDITTTQPKQSTPCVRIGIAKDKAFFFYYPDNIRLLERNGAILVPFSPINDKELPVNLDALYIGGGYPEEYADQLSANKTMLTSVSEFAASGLPVYAECGGLMYLSESLTTKSEDVFPMVGVLPSSTVMRSKLRTLGYAAITLSHDSILGEKGTVLRGHEFHYSYLCETETPHDEWKLAYTATRRSGQNFDQGFLKDNVLASYIHLHFGSNLKVPEFLINYIRRNHHE